MTLAQKARELERQLSAAVEEIKSEITENIGNASIPGIRKLSSNAFLVNSSMMTESWSPQYWDAKAQKAQILERLDGVETLDGLETKLRAMLENRKIIIHPVFRKILQTAHDDIVNAK